MDDIEAKELISKCLPTYQLQRKLGKGVHGNVYCIKDNLKERAVKIVPLFAERSLNYKNREEMSSRVSHDFHAVREYYGKIKGEGVVEIFDFHLLEGDISENQIQAFLVIVMEFCPGNLLDYIIDNYPLSSSEAYGLMEKLARTLKRLYNEAEGTFLVTDLKPSNLLLRSDGSMLIGDLGGLKRLSSVSTISTAQFSPNWSAPELVMRGESPGVSGAIYSYGLVSYFIWEGHLPYENEDFIERVKLLKDNGIQFTRNDIPKGISEVIRKCAEFESRYRPSGFDEILEKIINSRVRRSRLPESAEKSALKAGDASLDRKLISEQHSQEQDKSGKEEEHGPGQTFKEPVSGIRFIWVPGGVFFMGGLTDDFKSLLDEKPQKKVTMKGFWIGMYPITQGQWNSVMKSNPSHFKKGANYPVEQVSWKGAMDFIRRLSEMCGNRFEFGLPSEAQWEYAARSGGKEEEYAGGEDLDDLGWYLNNSDFSTHPVGEKSPNGLGIYDMSGNVLEWCEYNYPEKLKSSSLSSGEKNLKRVCRGGSWSLDAKQCKNTARRVVPLGLVYSNLGFRIIIKTGPGNEPEKA